jgi:hypothetical protein
MASSAEDEEQANPADPGIPFGCICGPTDPPGCEDDPDSDHDAVGDKYFFQAHNGEYLNYRDPALRFPDWKEGDTTMVQAIRGDVGFSTDAEKLDFKETYFGDIEIDAEVFYDVLDIIQNGRISTSVEGSYTTGWTVIGDFASDSGFYLEAYGSKRLTDTGGTPQLSTDNQVLDHFKWKQEHAGWTKGKKKWYLKGTGDKYLSAPAGFYECTICLEIKMEESGMNVKICAGFNNNCWFFLAARAKRVPKPSWAEVSGVTITLAGAITICFEPVSFSGWVRLTISRGFCVGGQWWTLGMTATFTIYAWLELSMSTGPPATFEGGISGGVKGGIFAPSYWGGRRRSKCACKEAKADGMFNSCPKLASAGGEIAFVLKMGPCEKGRDAELAGAIEFGMELNLFGIKIKLPKIPDIQLFTMGVRKPFGS